jgi:glycosyltransferase involved in cell wall biosynthesis
MNILVSINCITYNHEAYIRDAIEGFLMQRTDFEFEILLGEDCSTDNTRKMIEEYVRLYPNKIQLITSDKNVGVMENMNRVFKNSKGKYIALCEGDDYWTDPLKLQKQVDYMEQNPNCTLCFHNAEVVDFNNNRTNRNVVPWLKTNRKYVKENHIYSAGELALLGYIPTASYLFPKHLLENLPEWCYHAVVGDNVIKLITSNHGYAYYINETMCVYRFGVEGSATTRWVKENNTEARQINHCQGFIDLFDHFNSFSNFIYENEIDTVKKIFEFQILVIKREIKSMKNPRYKEIYVELDFIDRIKMYSKCYFPNLYRKLIELKRFVLKA